MRISPAFCKPFLSTGTLALVLLFTSLQLLLSSCEKEVNLNLTGGPSQFVVEGSIETGRPPFVLLTKSIGFSSKIDLNTLQNSFIHGAEVTIFDGTKTVALKEYSFDTGGVATFSFYSIDTSDLANLILGQENSFYTLTIKYDGKTYTSTTKIPTATPLDSMWTQPYDLPGPNVPDDARQLYANYKDPDTLGNYVRYYTKKNNEPFYPARDVFTDELINGTTVKALLLQMGRDRSIDFQDDSTRFIRPGDMVTIKWCAIDKGVYDFWSSFAYASSAAGNPFATPINVHSNISNGGLGVWAGYSVSTYTITAN